MKCTLAAILFLGLVVCAASARAKPEDVSVSVGGFDGKRVEDEPCVDESLREVVQTIAEHEELDGRSDDHFLRDMWDTTKEAFKEAFRTIKDSIIGAFRTAKDSIKYAAKSAGRQIKDKATEIVSTLWTKLTGGHAVVYSEGPSVQFDCVPPTAQQPDGAIQPAVQQSPEGVEPTAHKPANASNQQDSDQ